MPIHIRGTALTRVGLLLWGLLALHLLAGCNAIPGLGQQGTPTPHRTLLAIEQMLTATASIPTTTNTPLPTGTSLPEPTSTPTPEPPVQGHVGEALSAKDVGLTVLNASFTGELGGQKAAQGLTFLDLEVKIENLTSQVGDSLPYTSFYFTLSDDATQYSVYSFTQDALDHGMPPRLLGGDLLPGEAVRGHVAFEVPVEPGMLTLHFNPPAGAELAPPRFAVTLTETEGSIPTNSIPATGAPAVNSAAWLSDALPRRDQEVQLNGATLKIEMARGEGSFAGRRAPTGSRFLILDVFIRNDSRPLVPFNPQYFKVKDAYGYEYAPTILPGDVMLQAGSLPENAAVKGIVIFLIPADTDRVGVLYKPQVLAEEWDTFRVVINISAQ